MPSHSSAKGQRLLLVAPSHFRLWDDAGAALLDTIDTKDAIQLDPDDPAQASALGLALAAAKADVIVVPNRSRAALPEVVPGSVAVLSWITQPRVPAYDPSHPRDALLLADETWLAAARAAGWQAHRLKLAGWPTASLPPASENCLVLIADTNTLETPITRLDLSSHHVLWEMIRADLADPFSLGPDVNAFINRRMARLGISEEGFNRVLFTEKLILPAYQQGLARALIDAGLPLKLYGDGWEHIPHLRGAWHGAARTRGEFRSAVQSGSAIVYPWPVRHRHATDALNRPVLSPKWRRAEWLREAQGVLKAAASGPSNAILSRSVIDTLI